MTELENIKSQLGKARRELEIIDLQARVALTGIPLERKIHGVAAFHVARFRKLCEIERIMVSKNRLITRAQ